MALQDYFVWGSGGQKKTPDQIARERKIAEAMIASSVDTSPVGHWTQGAARMANALVGNIKQGRADAAEKAGIEGATNKFNSLDLAKILSGGQAAYPSSITVGASPTSAAATGTTSSPAGVSALPSSFLSALDKHEGGGDYNTLFGHAQRNGGEFSGVQVSQMPIKDVLAFADPSGRYAQSVKGKVGRVATPMGRHQIVGTTLRNAVREMGLDPNAAFDQSTQDAIANHLARRRIASANTLSGKMAALRSEWEGFRNVPDAQLAQIVGDLQGGGSAQPSVQVASLDPSIGIAQAYAPQSHQTANTAANAINMIAPPEPQGISQDQFNSRFGGVPESQPVQPQAIQQPDPMPTVAIRQTPQPQFSDNAIQQHDAMFGGALAPAGTAPQQAPAGQGYFPEAPAMGSYASMAPQSQQGGNQLQELMAAASDPFLNDSQRGMINMALQQQMQNADPMRQMQMQKLQRDLNTPAKRNTTSINGNLVDADTGQVIANFPEQTKPTSDIQNFEYARQNGFSGTFDQYQQMVKKAGASSTNVSVGEGDKFYEALDKKNAETFSSLSDTGVQARSKLAQIDRLRGLMAASPTGATAALKLAAGEYGIKTDGLDDLQASQALINELVPQQRQPGSGPMSDADLALFKQSLPRIINTPDGNNLILDTMTGITQYQMQMGDIADRVANREITAAQGRELIKNLKNPLEDFRKSSKEIGTGGNRTASGVQWSIEP